MLAHFHHARGQDALRAVEGGESLREPCHLAADGGFTLHHHHFVTGIGNVQRRLDSRHAAANHHRTPRHRNADGLERVVLPHLFHRHADDFRSLGRSLAAVVMHPRTVLADIGHLHHVGIEAGFLGRLAEGLQVHVRRTRGNHYRVQFLCCDLLPDHRLAGIRAHIFVVHGAPHAGNLGHSGGNLRHVNRTRDVLTTPADENPNPRHRLDFLVARYLVTRASCPCRSRAGRPWHLVTRSAGQSPVLPG